MHRVKVLSLMLKILSVDWLIFSFSVIQSSHLVPNPLYFLALAMMLHVIWMLLIPPPFSVHIILDKHATCFFYFCPWMTPGAVYIFPWTRYLSFWYMVLSVRWEGHYASNNNKHKYWFSPLLILFSIVHVVTLFFLSNNYFIALHNLFSDISPYFHLLTTYVPVLGCFQDLSKMSMWVCICLYLCFLFLIRLFLLWLSIINPILGRQL